MLWDRHDQVSRDGEGSPKSCGYDLKSQSPRASTLSSRAPGLWCYIPRVIPFATGGVGQVGSGASISLPEPKRTQGPTFFLEEVEFFLAGASLQWARDRSTKPGSLRGQPNQVATCSSMRSRSSGARCGGDAVSHLNTPGSVGSLERSPSSALPSSMRCLGTGRGAERAQSRGSKPN